MLLIKQKLIPYFAFIFSKHTAEITIAADKPNEAPTESPNTKPPITDIFGKDRANNRTKCDSKEHTKKNLDFYIKQKQAVA